ncbi:MAG: TatD family hydrolase [Dysgonamonadaceae bacterium]|jgi:TatD DNase family protein|nr:TatD family hydrolase [Dysgonamonadaceae bacterium]
MYVDIHTHHQPCLHEKGVTVIRNLNVSDCICCYSLDLQTNYSIGIHPWKIDGNLLDKHLRFMEQNIPFNCVKAVGECGLDKCCKTPWELQLRAFRSQIDLSEKFNKTLIIHCVKAFDELIALRKTIQPQQAWIIHGFRGNPQQAEQLIRQNFLLSFGSHFNEETVRKISPNKFFLETDTTDISIQEVYRKVAKCIGLSEESLITQIAQNCEKYCLIDA